MMRKLLERDGPLNELLATARNAAAGRGGTVLLEGEAGIGKTSLLSEFAAHADKSCRVLWGWCEALFTPRPLGPLQLAQRHDERDAIAVDVQVVTATGQDDRMRACAAPVEVLDGKG